MRRGMARRSQLRLGLLVLALFVGSNVAIASPILVSQDLGAAAYSASHASNNAALAFDGDAVSVWNSGGPVVGTPTWIEVDLGQSYEIDHFRFRNSGATIVAIDLYVSDSPIGGLVTDRQNPPVGVTRVAYYANTANVKSPATYYSWDVGDFYNETPTPSVATTEGRYVQAKLYVFMDGGVHTWGHINEFEVYAVPEPATMGLLALGGIAMVRRSRRRKM